MGITLQIWWFHGKALFLSLYLHHKYFVTDQLSRLHMILKPFMLRRVKKDVENELSDKVS